MKNYACESNSLRIVEDMCKNWTEPILWIFINGYVSVCVCVGAAGWFLVGK